MSYILRLIMFHQHARILPQLGQTIPQTSKNNILRPNSILMDTDISSIII